LYLINTTFTNNTATGGTAGGAGATAGIGNGGAIFIFPGATAKAIGAAPTFSGNSAAMNANLAGTVTTDTAATLTATAGTPQSATVSTAYATALQVTLKDGAGNPIPNAVITFTVPGSGASAALSAPSAVTNANGQASLTAKANSTTGTFTVTASFGTLSATFNLTNASSANKFYAVGADAGGGSEVLVYQASNNALVASFFAFAPTFTGGVRVAVADINGDGTADIICAAGPTGGPQVEVIDGTKLNQTLSNGQIATSALLASFFAFAPTFNGGVYVAAAVSSSGKSEIVCGAGATGGPQVIVLDCTKLGQTQSNGQIATSAVLGSFFAYAPTFTGGVRVAIADVNGDGTLDIICGPGPGGGPQVIVVDGTKLGQTQSNGQIAPSALLASFFAFAPSFAGGVFVSAGATNGSQVNLIVSPDAGGGPQVEVVNGSLLSSLQSNGQIANSALLASFNALPASFTGGVRVSFNGAFGSSARPAILTAAGPGASPEVAAFDPLSQQAISAFFALPVGFTGGSFIAG
jgi:hypothetical protein